MPRHPMHAEVQAGQGRLTPQIALASALVLLAMGALILVAVPAPLHAVSAWIGQSAGPGVPSWVVPAFTGGFALGGMAIGVWVLSGFVQGVQSEPFAWLAPVLVALCGLVASHAPGELPLWHLPAPLFAAMSALVWLGGGALLRLPGWPAKVVGAAACLSPVVYVVSGYALAAGGLVGVWSSAGAEGQLVLYAVTTTAVGIVLLAAVTGGAESAERGAARRKRLEAQIEAALSRARVSEQRLSQAEAEMGRMADRIRLSQPDRSFASPLRRGGEDTQELATLMKPGMAGWLKATMAVVVLAALGVGSYFGLHRPLVMRAHAQTLAAESRLSAQDLALAKLRAELETVRAEQQAALAAEQTSAREALAAAEAAKTELAALQAAQAEAVVAEPAPAPAPSKTDRRAAARSKARAAAARQARAEKTAAAREAREERAEAAREAREKRAEERKMREQTKGFSGSLNDDPIGGLGL